MSTTQQQIAEVFARHVGRYGYDKTTLDEVARELKISKKTIYVHFAGKREIYEYIVEREAAREKMRLSATVGTLPTYAARVEAVLRFVLSQGRGHIEETSAEEWLHEYEVAADAYRKAHGDLMREIIEQGVGEGEFAQGDASLAEKMIAAMVLEYLVIVNADPSYDRDEELVQRIMRFIG